MAPQIWKGPNSRPRAGCSSLLLEAAKYPTQLPVEIKKIPGESLDTQGSQLYWQHKIKIKSTGYLYPNTWGGFIKSPINIWVSSRDGGRGSFVAFTINSSDSESLWLLWPFPTDFLDLHHEIHENLGKKSRKSSEIVISYIDSRPTIAFFPSDQALKKAAGLNSDFLKALVTAMGTGESPTVHELMWFMAVNMPYGLYMYSAYIYTHGLCMLWSDLVWLLGIRSFK